MLEPATRISDAEVGDEDMARKSNRAKADEARVSRHESALKAASLKRDEFDLALEALRSDHDLTVADAIEIAVRYHGGGSRPSSKKAALELISRRFLELVRSQAQIRQAAKARPW
jgi:hypothetical protein